MQHCKISLKNRYGVKRFENAPSTIPPSGSRVVDVRASVMAFQPCRKPPAAGNHDIYEDGSGASVEKGTKGRPQERCFFSSFSAVFFMLKYFVEFSHEII